MRDDHERLMDRLRAADPVPAPPTPPTFDALLGDADPTATAPTSSDVGRRPAGNRGWLPRVPRPQLALGAMVVLLVAVVVAISSLGSGGSRIDVVAEAKAELSPSGEVVRLVLRGGPVQPDGTPIVGKVGGPGGAIIGERSRVSEQWSTGLPLRYLVRTEVLGPDGKPVATIENGRAEDGTSWEDNSWESRVRFGTSDSLMGNAANTINGFGANPTETVRTMLDAGTLRPNGETTFNGRRALRLTGEIQLPPIPDAPAKQAVAYRVDYLVDPNDYAPVGFRSRIQPPAPPGTSGSAPFLLNTELTVERYELLPLDATARALFRPPPRNP